jgi:predicted Fe-Mo cluster-binding NifX family protein
MEQKKMKIAFPSNDRRHVEEHFGHAKEFVFCTLENGKVEATEYVTPPAHAPGVIPAFVHEQGASAIITGGMGGMAVDIFKGHGIDVILGATGTIEENLETFIKGDLESTGSVCDHSHDHS